MDTLRVRVYNVRFGDAVLVSVPDQNNGETTMRHMLVDLGNVLRSDSGGAEDAVFGPVVQDIQKVLGGKPLDLYVMTHEHMDHVQGLLYASEKLGLTLDVANAWLTASSAEDYYDKHEQARRQKRALIAAYEQARLYLGAAPDDKVGGLRTLLLNNDPNRTGACVAFLRKLAAQTTYVHREKQIDGTHPFREAKLELWAPEEDTSAYYGRFRPAAVGVARGDGNGGTLHVPKPPRGVDSGAFYSLVESRRLGVHDNLLQIDKSANNSSIVFSLEWRGYRLLFPGDAEHRSWKEMHKRKVLKPVHFLKVSHHGSWNGTPTGEILEQILPETPPDDRRRYAAISTWKDTYPGVPDDATATELAKRCEVRSVEDARDELYVDFEFRA